MPAPSPAPPDRHLLIGPANIEIEFAVLAAHLARSSFGFLLKANFATVKIIEPARDFARHFDMRDLILANRHMPGLIYKNIRRLQ